jgi:Dopey, N-terminal
MFSVILINMFLQVLGILDRLSGTLSLSFFLQNIWLIMLTNPPARGTAYNYLSRRLPTLNPEDGKHQTCSALCQSLDLLKILIDITSIVGRDIGLMIRAFAAALEDDNLLVRRAALDSLVTSLRLDSVSVKNSRKDDRTILMRAAYSVILRRDLALNRRLYLWLLGPSENAKQQETYFRIHALELLKSTLEVCRAMLLSNLCSDLFF